MNPFLIVFSLAWTALSLSTPAHGAPVSVPNGSFEAPVLAPGGVAVATSTIDGPNNNDWAIDNARLEESAPENLTVTNPSFELPALPTNGAAVGAPTGWTGQGTIGYVRNGWNGGAINISNLHGNQAAWFNTDVGTDLHQNLTHVFETGRAYQLEVGAVKASAAWTGSTVGNQIQIQLYYGNFNVIASSSAFSEGLNDSQGALTDLVATLGAVQATDPWAGQQIGIRMITPSTVPMAMTGRLTTFG